MTSTSSQLQHRMWLKGPYSISTDASRIPISTLNEAFATKDVYWAKPLPENAMKDMLQSSLCFALFYHPENNVDTIESTGSDLIGFARCITDFTTFVYLTDVYIWPSHQGKGLGSWLVGCVQEVIEGMPYLRRSLCFTSDWARSVPFYEKIMDMEVLECKRGADGRSGEGLAVLMRKGNGNPSGPN